MMIDDYKQSKALALVRLLRRAVTSDIGVPSADDMAFVLDTLEELLEDEDRS